MADRYLSVTIEVEEGGFITLHRSIQTAKRETKRMLSRDVEKLLDKYGLMDDVHIVR